MPVSGDDASFTLDDLPPGPAHQRNGGTTSTVKLKMLVDDTKLDSANYAARLKDILAGDDDDEVEGHGSGNVGLMGHEDDEDEDEEFLYIGIDAPQAIGYDAQLADVLDEPQPLPQKSHAIMNASPTPEAVDGSASEESFDYNRYQVRQCIYLPKPAHSLHSG